MTLWASVIGTSLLLVISVAAIVAAWGNGLSLFVALITTGFNLGLFVCYVIRYACEAWSTIVCDDEDDE